jgi:hypothetical protein
MSSANMELLLEMRSTQDFPIVSQYLNKEIGPTIIKEDDRSYFIKKADMVNNCFEVPKTIDILCGIEITGTFTEPELLSTTRITRLSEIYRQIQSIDIEVGGVIITTIDLRNEVCEILTNQHFFTIHVSLDKIFYTVGFIPVIALKYNTVKIYIQQNSLQQNFKYDCYLLGAVLNANIRSTYLNYSLMLLYKDFHKYDGSISGNQMSMIYENGNGMSSTNFITSLYFKFDVNIRRRLKYIELKTVNDRLITMITLSRIHFIGDYEFIIDKFYYKTFLLNNIIIEFGLSTAFEDARFSLITTNYNVLIIGNGFSAKMFNNLDRKVSGIESNLFEKISDALFEEKVVPKNDCFCAITHDEFGEGDVRIISGCCFSSFKCKAIEMWFHSKKKKECPCCRVEGNVWWRR